MATDTINNSPGITCSQCGAKQLTSWYESVPGVRGRICNGCHKVWCERLLEPFPVFPDAAGSLVPYSDED